MRIAFFTEGNWTGKVSRDNTNMRTEMAWMCALNADHYNIHGGPIQGVYDIAICIIPKKNPQFDIHRIRTHCLQIASMQEGPHWYFQDYPLDQQIWYYNTLHEMDFLYVHNEIDKKYFQGLTGKKCKILPSLMIEDTLKDIPDNIGEGVMMGGNFCHWYGGFDGEESMENLTHLSYLNWTNWIAELSKRKYGVHLMRTHAAGTFALNCAYLGIPCIGYEGLDTQMKLHPDCTVEVGNITKAKQIAEKLRKDEKFYLYCNNNARKNYKKYYHEDQFYNSFEEQFKIP